MVFALMACALHRARPGPESGLLVDPGYHSNALTTVGAISMPDFGCLEVKKRIDDGRRFLVCKVTEVIGT